MNKEYNTKFSIPKAPINAIDEVNYLATKVELIIFDFDGVFTDNKVLVDQNGVESVFCSRSDGLGLRCLDKVNVQYYIVSSEKNPIVTVRAKKLKIPVIQGHENKLDVVKSIALDKKIKLSNIAYVGNDINDLECLESVGFPIAVADAYPEIISISKYQTKKKGGRGAVREICDVICCAIKTARVDIKQKTIIPLFPESVSIGKRDWGEENLLVLSSGNYTMKKLSTKAGKKGGIQYHRLKDEANYIISGEMILRYDDGSGNLIEKTVYAGDWFHFPAGCIHQEEAVTDVERIEVSTPHFNDRVRVDENYGLSSDNGLQTTKRSEIIFS